MTKLLQILSDATEPNLLSIPMQEVFSNKFLVSTKLSEPLALDEDLVV